MLASNVTVLVSITKMAAPFKWIAVALAVVSIVFVFLEFVVLLGLWFMPITPSADGTGIVWWQRVLNGIAVGLAGVILMINIALTAVSSGGYST